MNQLGDPGFGAKASDQACGINMHIFKRLEFGFLQNANAVHDCIRTLDCASGRCLVAHVAKHGFYLPDITVRLNMHRFVRTANSYANAPTSAGHTVRDIAADKARATENCDDWSCVGHGRDSLNYV